MVRGETQTASESRLMCEQGVPSQPAKSTALCRCIMLTLGTGQQPHFQSLGHSNSRAVELMRGARLLVTGL